MREPTVLLSIKTTGYTARVVRYAPFQQMSAHAHEVHGISAVLGGSLLEEAHHRSVTASAGWIVNKPRAVEHVNRFGPAGATLLAISPAEAVGEAPKGWSWTQNAPALRAGLRLLRANSDEDALVELIAALQPYPQSGSASWLEAVKVALDDGSAQSVSAMAAEASVHPVYLARAFRAQYGMSVRAYRLQVKVRRAMYLIATTPLSLTQVALETGFAEHSHMCRSFRVVAGWKPGLLRR